MLPSPRRLVTRAPTPSPSSALQRQRLQEARKAWSKQARFQGASEHNATVVNKRRGLATKDLLSPAEAEAEAFDDGEGSPGPMSGPTASVAELANSCLCLGPHSWVRRACAAIAQSPTFTASIAVVIVGERCAATSSQPRSVHGRSRHRPCRPHHMCRHLTPRHLRHLPQATAF